jgi:hypothetical protein
MSFQVIVRNNLFRSEEHCGEGPSPDGSVNNPTLSFRALEKNLLPVIGKDLRGATPHFVRGDNKKTRGDNKKGSGGTIKELGEQPYLSFRAEREISTSKSSLQGKQMLAPTFSSCFIHLAEPVMQLVQFCLS